MKKFLLLLMLVMFASVIVGAPADAADKIFRFATRSNLSTVYPFGTNNEIMDYCGAKLYRWIPDGDVVVLAPELAIGEPTTEDGFTWIIKIDPNAKWSNGEPITADTFIESWKRALDPKMVGINTTTSGLAKNNIEVENAFAYYSQADSGKPVAWEEVGFKKVDDHTLSVKATERHTPTQVMQHFQMRYTGPVYIPLFDAGIDETKTRTNYGTEVEYYMSAGPMKLVSFVKGAEILMEKNENYVHADEIQLDGMVCRIVQDLNTQLQLYQSGELDYITLNDQGALDLYIDDPNTFFSENARIYELQFNFENPDKPYLNNLNFRRALFYGIDRAQLAKLTNDMPAPYFLPTVYTFKGGRVRYRDVPEAQANVPANDGYDPELAKKYFDEALKETGVSKVDLHIMYSESAEQTRLVSESLQNSLAKLFGEDRFSITLSSHKQAQIASTMRNSQKGPTAEWDMGWATWNLMAAFYSPNRKFEVYRTNDKRRYTNYQNKLLDELYEKSISEEYRLDEDKLIGITAQMERALIDNVDVLPVIQVLEYIRFSDRVAVPDQNLIGNLSTIMPYLRIK